MSSNYPGSLDNFSTSHADGVNETIHASTVNDLADAVNKIESTLGANPVLTSNFSQVRKITSSSTATSTDYQILGDASSGSITVTLPAASNSSGQRVLVRKIDTFTQKSVTISPNGTDTIDGVNAGIVLRRQYDQAELVSDGTGWQRLGAISGNAASSGGGISVLYVDTQNGNDSWDGRFSWRPKKTISAAIGQYRTVYVMAGVYQETVDVGGLTGLRLLGVSSGTNGTSTSGVIVQAPSSSASCLKASSATNSVEIGHMSFMGELEGGAGTYTGTVFDGSLITTGSCIHDVSIYGIGTSITGAKTTVGKGTVGGIGLKLDNCEQAQYRNVTIGNCHKAIYVPGANTYSKVELANFHLSQSWIVYQEDSTGTTGGENLYRNWKTQNVFGLSFAIAQLNSNGSNPADGDTVVIRDKTYRFKNTMALANDIKIGASIDATLLSLVHAVNGTGTVGTDYFTGTTAPTGMKAGWMNLVDYGASGGNGFNLDVVDTTRHACTFQLTDTLGTAGNAFTFTVSSANLSDYLGLGTFGRGAWAMELHMENRWEHVNAMENISLPAGDCILIASNMSYFVGFKTAPQTQVSVTGNANYFLMPQLGTTLTVQSGATNNEFKRPANAGASNTSSGRITDNGTSTVISLV